MNDTENSESIEPRIVAAVGASAISGLPSLGRMIQSAMTQAVKDCHEKGISDPDAIRAAMLEARKKVRESFNAMAETISRDPR